MNTSGIMQTIIETSVDAEQAIATMEATAKAAAEWAKAHKTTITHGRRGYAKPTFPGDVSLKLERESSDYYGGTFDRLVGLMVSDLLSDDLGGVYMWVLAYADDETDVPTLYAGTVKDHDSDNIIFYDDVTVYRDYVIGIGA